MSDGASVPTVEEARKDYAKLLDPQEPLDSRMRELYRLKESCLKTVAGVTVLLEAIDTTDSVLLQHELAYNVGQSGREEALPGLERIVRDASYDVVTRHEAAEALGAIGSPLALRVLEAHGDPAKEPEAAIRETCELALARLAMKEASGEGAVAPPQGCEFVSVDPSPAFSALYAADDEPVPQTVAELEAVLLDTSGRTRLFRRYMAMFSLRNLATEEAVAALCRGLREDTVSLLFRHEVAFVLGQLERPSSQPALIASLKDEEEAPMVRHEAAEALGAIADPATLPVLEAYATHHEPVVRDSCVVALEMHKYWANFNSLGQQQQQQQQELHA
ncbi:deoxyhypusine hydroxylase [Novymonas esmeraldas]|uniref:Deoxyhypusine hydroxylase n=1 Tax=Novymonas esmeraldas TaxID=1808958 RepID=A0AAW0EKS4_9TRYP